MPRTHLPPPSLRPPAADPVADAGRGPVSGNDKPQEERMLTAPSHTAFDFAALKRALESWDVDARPASASTSTR